MKPDDEIVLQLEGLQTHIETQGGTARAVDGVSFELRRGQTFALLGESGCGKSMTALSLLRLLPDAGRIGAGRVMLGEVDLLTLTEARMRAVRGGEVAMIFQEPGTSLNPVLTVGRQIAEVLERHLDLSGKTALARAVELLAAVGIPDPERRLGEYPFQLSGGMKQRVMIAMALAAEPRVLVADEPTTALDVTIQAQVLDLLAGVQRSRGMAMLLITHDLGVVARMAHQVGVMYAGELVEVAERDRFFSAPAHPYSRKLFDALPRAERRTRMLDTLSGSVPPLDQVFVGCRFAERCPSAFEPCRSESPDWTTLAAGHRLRCHLYGPRSPGLAALASAPGSELAPDEHRHGKDAVLEVRDLKVHFPICSGFFKRQVGAVKAVDGVSLRIAEGRTLALVGESGCGKTTVGKAILQLIAPSGGEVHFDGRHIDSANAGQMRHLRAGMQMIFQDPFGSLNPRMRVGQIISEGIDALGAAGDRGETGARVAGLLRDVGLDPSMAQRFPHEFSGGQRQRIAVARSLAVQPRVLICDEPTSALDVSVQAQVLNLLRELQARFGLSYLFITHNIAVVDYLAHDVAVMYLGRIVESGSADEVLRGPMHPYTRALLAAVPRIEGSAALTASAPVGEMPSAAKPPQGCHFHPRCAQASARCRVEYPGESAAGGTHRVRCHLFAL